MSGVAPTPGMEATAGTSTADLYGEAASVAFYERRFADAYLDDWTAAKKERIAEIVRALDLPAEGDALEFGCGTGVFTEVLRTALPAAWQVHGTDLSDTALEKAAARYPGCSFHGLRDGSLAGCSFDLVLTHHVLEHVFDLGLVLGQIDALTAEGATVVHVLPCRNAGSFEHELSLLRVDGIDESLGNRYYFEDEGHVRRLTSDELVTALAPLGYELVDAAFANQRHGAIEWITESSAGFINALTDADRAADAAAAGRLLAIRRQLLLLWGLRLPARIVDSVRRRPRRSAKHYAAFAASLPLYPFSKTIDAAVRLRSAAEWHRRRKEPNGSEMYLVFTRCASA